MRTPSLTAPPASRRAILLVLGLFAALSLAACGGGSAPSSPTSQGVIAQTISPVVRETPAVPAQPAPAGALPLGLPFPTELPRGVSAGDAHLIQGAGFDGQLPSHNLTVQGTQGQFKSKHVPGVPLVLGDCAYGVYRFTLPGLSGGSLLTLHFQSPLASGCYYGLGNWSTSRWDWFTGATNAPQSISSISPYVAADGTILVAVLTVPNNTYPLSWVRIGSDVAPTAALSPATDQVINQGDFILFDGSSSSDLDGSITGYEWDVDGTPGYEVSGAGNSLNQQFVTPGVIVATLRVTDDQGATGTASIQVTVNAVNNTPPVANLQADVTSGNAPLTVNFDAGASTDADGSITKYEWDFEGDGTYFAGDDTLVPTTQHIYAAEGDFTATVRVTDNIGATDSVGVPIHVTLNGNQNPIANLTVTEDWQHPNADVAADAVGSADPDGSIASYEWDWDDDGVFEDNTGTTTTNTHQYASNGLKTLRLKVTDNLGATATTTHNIYIYGGGPYDEVEDNDDYTTGNTLPNFPFNYWDANVGVGGYDGDQEDFFKLIVPQAGVVTIDMYLKDSVDCDVDMWLIDSDGTTNLDTSTGTGDKEEVQAYIATPGTYYVRCFRYASASGIMADYFLAGSLCGESAVADIQVNGTTTGVRPLTVTLKAFDETSNCGSAKNTQWDIDGDGIFEADLDGMHSVTPVIYKPGSYTCKCEVTDFANVVTDDTVQLTVTGTEDEVEPNDDNTTANPLSMSEAGRYGDVGPVAVNQFDWYKLTVPSAGTITVHMDIFDPLCDIDVRLYNDTDLGHDQYIAGSTGTSNTEQFTYDFPAAGTYYVKVYAYSTSANDPKSGGYRLSTSFP